MFTIAGEGHSEFKEKGSKFIGLIKQVSSRKEAGSAMDEIHHMYHSARHIPFAWRIMDGDTIYEKASDDGEPCGTAGKPILISIQCADLVNVTLAVVRYFGGIKLGTGPLSRAFSIAAKEAIKTAVRAKIVSEEMWEVKTQYKLFERIESFIKQTGGHVEKKDFDTAISMTVIEPLSSHDEFCSFLKGLSGKSGGVVWKLR